MAIQQPTSTDSLSSPDHSKLHRVIASDDSAADKSIVVDGSGKVGIGTETPVSDTDLTLENGGLSLKEVSAPGTSTGYGKIYPKTDKNLYYKDSDGLVLNNRQKPQSRL